jgi:propanediol dehydratase small subunit
MSERPSLDDILAGRVSADAVRISAQTLREQAEVAEAHHNPQLAANFRRAAELTVLPDDEVMGIYEALRPGRVSCAELRAIAADLHGRGLPLTSAFIAEAADIYERRGLST